MKITRHEKTLKNTLDKIVYLIQTYNTDTKKFKRFSIVQMFNFLAVTMKYIPDPKNHELVMRPKILLERRGGDCDDKTIFAVSWFIQKNITTGFSIVSQDMGKQFHHIFPFYMKGKRQIDFDCTYPQNKINETKRWFKRKDFIIYRSKDNE